MSGWFCPLVLTHNRSMFCFFSRPPRQMHSSLYSPRCLEALLFRLTLCRPPTTTDCAHSQRQRGCVITNWMQSQCQCALFKAALSGFLGCPSLADVFRLCEISVDSKLTLSLCICVLVCTCTLALFCLYTKYHYVLLADK